MTLELATPRLRLRPLTLADTTDLERLVFADAEVAKWLAHDVSKPGNARRFARGWCKHLGYDGANDTWARGGYGAFAITDRHGEFAAPGSFLGIVGFYGSDKIDGKWRAEFFYALGTPYHGRGIMSEAARRALQAWRELADAGDLYAVYWHTLNHASGRILRKLGFVEDGPCSLVAEYGNDDVMSFIDFELWRIESAEDTEFDRIAREAATKIGHIAHEGLLSPSQALTCIRRSVFRRTGGNPPDDRFEMAFEQGMRGEGLLHLQYSMAA